MSVVESSSDDDCYVNSAKALKAMRKEWVVLDSPIAKESPPSSQDFIPSYVSDECIINESPPAPRNTRSRRNPRRRNRRNVNYEDPAETENMPELFAKKKPMESISLVDSDPDDITTVLPDDLNISADDADENYEINLKIDWQSSRLERLPLRRYQEFSKVFEHFSNKENVPQERISLKIRDQITIQPSDTPDSLGLTVVDIIEGGIIAGKQSVVQTVNVPLDKDSISIKIQTKDQKKSLSISIKKSQKIKVLIMKCAEQLQIPEDKIKFQFDGEEVHPNETPESLDLEGGECFDMHTIP